MKKITFLILILFSVNWALKAQPCSDFNSGIGNWTILNGYTNLSYTNAIDATTCLTFYNNTTPPDVIFYNSVDYNSLGTNYLHSCLSFDYSVYNDGVFGTVPVNPRIYLTDGVDTIWFEAYASLTEGSSWMHVVAPIELTSSPTSPLPSNSYGSWYMSAGMTNADFDNVMLNSSNIFFLSLGRAGITQGGTQEDIRVDNMCVGACDDLPCSTFDNIPAADNWVNSFCTSNYTNINPLDGTLCATLTDNSGPSWFNNSIDFNNLGTNYLGKCLCFDYNVTNDGVSGSSVSIYPTIYLFLGTQWIAFQSKTAITEGSTWVHLCANIELTTAGALTLPENSDGQWIMDAGMTWMDFNNVLTGNTSIGFAVDVAGSTLQTEDIRVDNICVQDCPNTDPCDLNYEFSFTINTDPAALNNYVGKITINTLNPTSTYDVDWGDFTTTTSPPPHLVALSHVYAPGSYIVCVTEIMEDGRKCTKCIRICVPDYLDNGSGGSGDGGEPTGSPDIKINNKNELEPASQEIQLKLKDEVKGKVEVYPNPANNKTSIDFKIDRSEFVKIQVMDVLGNVVILLPGKNYESGSQTVDIDSSKLNSGMYTIVVKIGDTEVSEKLVIVK
jgi:hypothetical protein